MLSSVVLISTHYPQDVIWGGTRNYSGDAAPALVDAYVQYGHQMEFMPSTYTITTLYYHNNTRSATVDIYNPAPHPPTQVLGILDRVPHVHDNCGIKWASDIAESNFAGQPYGFRQTYWTATYQLDQELAQVIRAIFEEETVHLGDLPGLEARLIMQHLSPVILKRTKRSGGNPLGISEYNKTLMILNLAFRWEEKADDFRILQANMNIQNRISEVAKMMGLDIPFLYMNYASSFQNVLHSYGADNLKRLRLVSKEYDPKGVFQQLQSGSFKLSSRTGW